MFRKLVKNKKAQNTAEYAILISLVVAGIIAMQTFAQRAIQARIRDAAHYGADITTTVESGAVDIDGTLQAEPYYLDTNYQISRYDEATKSIDATKKVGGIRQDTFGNNVRAKDGYTRSMFNGTYGVIQ